MNGLAGRFLFGGGLGLALAFLLANYLSVALLSVYGDWLGWRQVTGAAPNALTSITQKITWALFFCSSWWMFWKFDAFFPLRPRETSDSNQSEEEESEFVEKEPSVEYFKPERDETLNWGIPTPRGNRSCIKINSNPNQSRSLSPLSPKRSESTDEFSKSRRRTLRISMPLRPFTENASLNTTLTKSWQWVRKFVKLPSKKPRRSTSYLCLRVFSAKSKRIEPQ